MQQLALVMRLKSLHHSVKPLKQVASMTNEPSPWPDHPAGSPRVIATASSRVAVSPCIRGSPWSPTIYEIVPVSTQLPVIDNTKTIKRLLFNARNRQRVNQFYRRHRLALVVTFFVGLVSVGFGALARPDIARPTAVISCIAMIPGQLSYALEIRYQFIKLLAQSFEFWYTTTLITVWAVSGATMFNDVRTTSLLMPWIGMEFQLLGDGCTRPHRWLVVSAGISVVLCGSFMTFAAFDLIDEIDILRIAASRDGRLVVSNRDIFINTTLPLMILGTRLGYTKHQALKHRDGGDSQTKATTSTSQSAPLAAVLPSGRVVVTPGVRCMVYRCTLKLQCYTGTARGRSRNSLDTVPAQPPESRLLPLRAVRIRDLFHAGNTVFPSMNPTRDLEGPFRLLYHITGLIGLIATASCFYSHVDDTPDVARIVVALVCTTAYCGYFFCVSHCRLLRRLCHSFDFVFVLVQITLELVAVADLYGRQWTASLGGVVPCWLWFWHVMTLDAITPQIKQRLGLRVQFSAPPILLLVMIGHVWLVAEVLIYNHLGFEDRVLVELVLGAKVFKLKAASFALTRSVTSFVWTARLLRRIWSSSHGSDDCLIILQGYVEFDDVRHGGVGSSRTATSPGP